MHPEPATTPTITITQTSNQQCHACAPSFLFPLCINIDLFHWVYFFVPFDSTNRSLYIYYIGVPLSWNCLLLEGEVHFLDSFNLSYRLFDSISKSMLRFVMHTRTNPLVLCCLHFTWAFVTPLSLLCHQNMWLDDRNEASCLEFEIIILHFNSNLFFLPNAHWKMWPTKFVGHICENLEDN